MDHSETDGTSPRPKTMDDELATDDDDGYGRKVGERLRAIRRQKGLSLQEVEAGSQPGVQGVGARRLRAGRAGHLGAPPPAPGRVLQRARSTSSCPATTTSPPASSTSPRPGRSASPGAGHHRPRAGSASCDAPGADLLIRYLPMIQVQRQDFNGRMLTIRRDDLRAIACILDTERRDTTVRLELAGPRARRPSAPCAPGAGILRGRPPPSASTSTSRSAPSAATTAPSPPGPTAATSSTSYLAACRADIERAVAAGHAAGDERVRRRRHAVAGAGRRAGAPSSTPIPLAAGRRGHRRVQPRHGHRRAASPPTSPAASNRLSFGVQSMVPHVLAALGRTHDPANVRRVRRARPPRTASPRSTST